MSGTEGRHAEDSAAATIPDAAAGPPDMSTPVPGMATTHVPVPGMKTTNIPGMVTTQVATLDGTAEPRGRGGSDVRAMALTPGTEIDGKYRLEAMLGRGGMGIVWRAEHSHLHGSVAIKFVADRFRRKPQVIERFWQEAKLMGEIGHPNIVRVLDISPASAELPYVTMELLTQGSLRDLLKKSGGRVPAEEAVELVDGVLSALIAAHKRGIVHRDIKPDNLMLANIRNIETDTFELGVKVLDFGASLLLSDTAEQNAAEGLLGTPYYMSPEQAGGLPLDQRTDLYSTAVVLYELISGKLPHTAEDVHSLVFKIATEEAKPIVDHVPNITRPYRGFFARALAMDPSQRFQSAEEMREAMRTLSKRLAGKVRNTALYMASGDTGPMQTIAPPPKRQETRPLEPFRKVLDSQVAPLPPASSSSSAAAAVSQTGPGDGRPQLGAILLGALLGAPLGVVLQTLRYGSLGQLHVVDTVFACLAFAGLGSGVAWWWSSRPRAVR